MCSTQGNVVRTLQVKFLFAKALPVRLAGIVRENRGRRPVELIALQRTAPAGLIHFELPDPIDPARLWTLYTTKIR